MVVLKKDLANGLRFGLYFGDFKHFSVFAKWIQGSLRDAEETLAKT